MIAQMKTLGITLIFTHVFFKFAWAYRLFNYTAILLGSTPPPSEAHTAQAQAHVAKLARMATLAGRHFKLLGRKRRVQTDGTCSRGGGRRPVVQ